MLKALISMFTGGSTLLPKIVAVVTITSALSGGAAFVYSTVKAKGAAELQASIDSMKYEALKISTGKAIEKLNKLHAASMLAAAERRKADEVQVQQSSARIAELEDILKDDENECLRSTIGPDASEWVRNTAKSVGGQSAP